MTGPIGSLRGFFRATISNTDSRFARVVLLSSLTILFASVFLRGGDVSPAEKAPAPPSESESTATAAPGQESELEATARRNENVPLYRLDTNEQQELNKRVGSTPVIVEEFEIQKGYYASEVGNAPGDALQIRSSVPRISWHGEVFENHQNSALNSRSFFQVGPVQPARQNVYGANAGGPMGRLGNLTGNFSQEKVRGMVNGNVLIPLESERTPLASDPQIRQVVGRILSAYPEQIPNRVDFDPRALNTNAPQRIDSTSAGLRFDRPLGNLQNLAVSFAQDRSNIDAFQLVVGQNPDMAVRNHRGQVTHTTELSPQSVVELTFVFQRIRSVLSAEPDAFDSEIRVSHQIQDLGPSSEYPVDRTQNTFTWGGTYARVIANSAHTLKLGGSLTRVRLDGIESNYLRGSLQFSNSFGRSAIDNLLHGTPSKYIVTLGDPFREFRNWRGEFFVGDEWQVGSKLRVSYGMRYGFEARPSETHLQTVLPYSCDCNNFAPRLALAYRPGGTSTVVRASYTVSYGEIYPVTYHQIRNNAPGLRQYQVQNPDLVDPLSGVALDSVESRTSPTRISPDLVAPYSHQYSLSVQHLFQGLQLRWGYVGSRTFKLFKPFVLNRAEVVAGIPQLPETVDERRPDSRFAEIYSIANAGAAYLDAAQIGLVLPDWKGLSASATYTFSKAIDTGADYTSTAAGSDLRGGRNQDQYEMFADLKGLSNFDSPHALLVFYSYNLPRQTTGPSWLKGLLSGWRLSGTALAKNGTPFTIYVGSDSPGFGNVDGSGGDRPNLLDPSILGLAASDPDTSAEIFSRERFGFIEAGQLRGNLGRSVFRKGPIRNINLALSRQWTPGAWREASLQFRFEAYNLTNSPQFDEPQRQLTSSSFGRITNTLNQGRVLQVGLKLMF